MVRSSRVILLDWWQRHNFHLLIVVELEKQNVRELIDDPNVRTRPHTKLRSDQRISPAKVEELRTKVLDLLSNELL
jgi:hypothetical protein